MAKKKGRVKRRTPNKKFFFKLGIHYGRGPCRGDIAGSEGSVTATSVKAAKKKLKKKFGVKVLPFGSQLSMDRSILKSTPTVRKTRGFGFTARKTSKNQLSISVDSKTISSIIKRSSKFLKSPLERTILLAHAESL